MVYGYGNAQQPASVVLCGARGLRLGLLGGGRQVVGYTSSAPTRDLCQGSGHQQGLHRGLKAQQGPTLAKTVVGGWGQSPMLCWLVERLVVDALWR